jgi:cbb3-type cytochrome oxidase maturation protein
MTAIYLLIPISLIILVIAVRSFVWAVNNKQFNNLEDISQTMLFEDTIQDRKELLAKQESTAKATANPKTQNTQVQSPSKLKLTKESTGIPEEINKQQSSNHDQT